MSIAGQINRLVKESGIVDIDTDYKRGKHTEELRGQGFTDWHSIGQQTHIVESGTFEKYKNTWSQIGKFSRDNGYGTNIKKISAECVQAFLTVKLESGRSYNTMISYLSAINKLDAAVHMATGHAAPFSGVADSMRQEIKDTAHKTDTETRAYTNPDKVMNAITDPIARLCAEIQRGTGLRVHDVTFIRLNENGTLNINSKAGRRFKNFPIPQHLSDKLREINGGAGKFNLSTYNHYNYELKKACNAVGENFTGTHAWRHVYARESLARHLAAGCSMEEAKGRVSEELFHHRLAIIEVYLR